LNIIPVTTPTGTVITMLVAKSGTRRRKSVRVPRLTAAPRLQLAQKPRYCRQSGPGTESEKVIRRFQKKFQVIATPMPIAKPISG